VPRGQPKDPDLQLDSLIEKQHEKRVAETGAERDREQLWKESVRRYHSKRIASFSWGWVHWYQNLAETQERADFLVGLLGILEGKQ
jgi:hypothetical protein